jgi:hypothetical protein
MQDGEASGRRLGSWGEKSLGTVSLERYRSTLACGARAQAYRVRAQSGRLRYGGVTSCPGGSISTMMGPLGHRDGVSGRWEKSS